MTPDDDTVPTNSTVLLQGHVIVPLNVPLEFAPGLKVIVKVPESNEKEVMGLTLNTSDPAVMVKDPPATRPVTFHVWVCEPPGEAVNIVDPENSTGQAVAVRSTMDIEHSSIK